MKRDETDEQEIARIAGAHDLGLAFVKTLILLHSGSIVVLMTHIGTAKSDSAFHFDLAALKLSLAVFLIGITVLIGALIVSYFYTALNHASKTKDWLDSHIIGINTCAGVVSLLSFVFGVAALICNASTG